MTSYSRKFEPGASATGLLSPQLSSNSRSARRYALDGRDAFCLSPNSRSSIPRAFPEGLTSIADSLARREGVDQESLRRAQSMLEECHAVALEISDIRMTAYTVGVLGSVARRRGDYELAQSHLGEALRMHSDFRDRVGIVRGVEALPAVLAERGRGETAIELVGATSAMRETIQLPAPPAERAVIDATLATARAAMAPDTADRAFARGRRLTPDATLARALASLSVRT